MIQFFAAFIIIHHYLGIGWAFGMAIAHIVVGMCALIAKEYLN